MNRRTFLGTSLRTAGALYAGLVLPACTSDAGDEEASGTGTASSSVSLPGIGLQLYTIRNALEADFRDTMEKVARIGYDEVEFAGYYDRSPENIGTLLDDLALTAPATHVSLARIRETPDTVLQTAQAIGHEYVVCPYLSEDARTSLDDYRQRAEEFSTFGKRCTEAGLQFAYHNHDFEFVEMEGTRPYDVLLAETDAEHVQMELDLYWVLEAGHDPLDYIGQNPDRYPLCHVKDRSAAGEMVSVGEGTVDFAALFSEADFQHYFVEHDNPDAPMQSIKTSYRTLDALS